MKRQRPEFASGAHRRIFRRRKSVDGRLCYMPAYRSESEGIRVGFPCGTATAYLIRVNR